jgi:hypothetical protein
MNELALILIGLILGLSLALVAGLTYALWTSARSLRQTVTAALADSSAALAASTLATDKLRGEVSLSLSRMDAERLYAASLSIQRASKSLAGQVGVLQKTLFAAAPAPALDFAPSSPPDAFGLDDEALDDARMVQERARWQQAGQAGGAVAPLDPLAGLTDAEKSLRVQQYFERRRAAGEGNPLAYPPTYPPTYPPSTPPAPGSGAYSSLLDDVALRPTPTPPPADFPDLAGFDGSDGMGGLSEAVLTDKGELE